MNKTKIKIAESSDGYPYWGPLLPIVEYCLQLGCKLDGRTVEEPFFEDRNGSNECWIYGQITTQQLLKKFDLPDSFETSEKYISDKKNRSVIFLRSFEDFEKKLEKRKKKIQKRKEQQERIRKRLRELEG